VSSDTLVPVAAAPPRSTTLGRAFWWRLADNFFRRSIWFLLPVLAMGAFGVMQALNTKALYRTSATLSAGSNPLLPEQSVNAGGDARLWETPGAQTARIIGERLGTDAFLRDVAESAGLGEALESGLIDIDVVRASVWAADSGDTLLSINATWEDPKTSFELVASTIDEYGRYLTETVTTDAVEAEAFWTERLDTLQAELSVAEEELGDYAASLPPLREGQDYPPDVTINIERLSGNLEAVEAQVRETEAQIDTAVLTQSQQATEAGRSYNVVDQPRQPEAPESTLMKKAMLVVSFVLMGFVIALAALLLTTALDRSIASAADLSGFVGLGQIATVAPLKQVRGRRRERSRGERGRRARNRPAAAGVA
jgi:uncharacterized protein involved in exopolysaccharide biosynthesis